jgi:RNA polymerase sigma-70 factor (ECF subfamily)
MPSQERAEPDRAIPDKTIAELRSRLAAAVRRTCPAWLQSSAEDIVQSAVMRVLGAMKTREGVLELSALYLERAAYCATLDEIRRHRRRREEQAADDQVLEIAASVHGDPEALAEANEITRALAQCLGALLDARKRAVTLHLLGHSFPETGALLGWSSKRAENLVCRGLADLRRCLAAKGMTRWRIG